MHYLRQELNVSRRGAPRGKKKKKKNIRFILDRLHIVGTYPVHAFHVWLTDLRLPPGHKTRKRHREVTEWGPSIDPSALQTTDLMCSRGGSTGSQLFEQDGLFSH